MREKKRAAPMLAHRQATPQQSKRTVSIADQTPASKQELGRCLCGMRIGSGISTLRCVTCSAWRRWRRRSGGR